MLDCRVDASPMTGGDMRTLVSFLFGAATIALSACHPTSVPATEGTPNNAAAAISAGSAPGRSADTPGLAASTDTSPAQAVTDANTAATAISAQAASAPAS